MTAEEKSAASVENTAIVRAAECTLDEVRKFVEYDTTDEALARTRIADAVATQSLLRTNGKAIVEFPSYDALRFIACATEDRGFFNSQNTRSVRAACCRVYDAMTAAGYNKNRPHAGRVSTTRSTSADTVKVQKKIYIDVQDDTDAMLEDAHNRILEFVQNRNDARIAEAQESATKIVAKMSDAEKRALIAALQASL